MQKGPTTPKGFRDIDPQLAKKRREAINSIAKVLEEFEFVPLETPIVEFAETLTGKYGEEEKLIYKFTDRGGRELALRYDLTVPLARYIANNLALVSGKAFRRYQIGEVFRGENTQKGRYREFTQFDFDTVGTGSPLEDAAVIATAIKASRKLGLMKAQMAINDRVNFKDLPVEVIRAWDKLYKIGLGGIKDELKRKGFSEKEIEGFVDQLNQLKPGKNLEEIIKSLQRNYNLQEGVDFFFDKTLARGLDYYTGLVMELKPTGKAEEQSIGGGGRYDNLIGMFAGTTIPAVGFSFGLDRLLELL